MKVCFFQHVSYESPGYILDWAKENGHSISFVNFYQDATLPEMKNLDALVVMGGPMNIGDISDEYAWLEEECEYVKQFIKSGKKILGICLGSQMIADALGAKVYRNKHVEIGWHKVIVDQSMVPHVFSGIFPNEFITFHWHGDTFNMPTGIKSFASSAATINQGFIQDNVAAFQFHPEMTLKGITDLIYHNEMVFNQPKSFVQPADEIVNNAERYIEFNRTLLLEFLDRFFEK